MNRETVNFFKARDISEILNATFAFLRLEFKYLWKVTLYLFSPFVILMAAISFTFQESFSSITVNGVTPTFYFNLILLYLILFLLYVFVTSMMNNYLLLYINDDDRRTSPINMLKITLKDFGLTAKITFLYGLLLLGITFGVVIIATAFSLINFALAPIVVFLVMFPIFYVFVSLSFIFIIAIHERVSFSTALTRSYNLIKNYWWFTFGVYFLIYLLVFVLQLVFLLPEYIVTFTIRFNSENATLLTENSFVDGLVAIYSSLSYFFYGIPFITTGIHYYSQKEKKEAVGLAKKIESLEGDVSTESE